MQVWAHGDRAQSRSLADWDTRNRSTVATQRMFRAAPDGKHFGWVDPSKMELHIVDEAGGERKISLTWNNDWRFSGDGKRVAAITGVMTAPMKVVVMDLATGDKQELGHVHQADQVDWVKDGVVVHEYEDGEDRLTYLPLEGERRVLVDEERVETYRTAWAGDAVYYTNIRDEKTIVYRVAVSGGEPEELGALDGASTNGEVAPDGASAAFVTLHSVYLAEGGKVRPISSEDDVRTIWYSADGKRLLFVSPERASVREGDGLITLKKADDSFQSARFIDGGSKVLVAAGARVIRWDVVKDSSVTVAQAPKGARFLAADALGEDLYLWAARSLDVVVAD